jgi:hypothetical protein
VRVEDGEQAGGQNAGQARNPVLILSDAPFGCLTNYWRELRGGRASLADTRCLVDACHAESAPWYFLLPDEGKLLR